MMSALIKDKNITFFLRKHLIVELWPTIDIYIVASRPFVYLQLNLSSRVIGFANNDSPDLVLYCPLYDLIRS